MKMISLTSSSRSQRGSFAALAFVALAPLLVAIGAFAVDTQHFQASRAELQRACDAAALAGAAGLGKYGEYGLFGDHPGKKAAAPGLAKTYIETRARSVAGLNEADGRSVADHGGNLPVSVGVTIAEPTANFGGTVTVQATMRIASLFAQILGPQFNAQDVRAQAIAGPSGTANVAFGHSLWPSVVSISTPDPDGKVLKDLKIGDVIKFEYQSSGGSSAAWTALEKFPGGNCNAAEVRERMDKYGKPIDPSDPANSLKIGDPIEMSNGTMDSCLDHAAENWKGQQVIVPVTNSTLAPGEKSATIIGFMVVTILGRGNASDKWLEMRINNSTVIHGVQEGVTPDFPGLTPFFADKQVRTVKLLG